MCTGAGLSKIEGEIAEGAFSILRFSGLGLMGTLYPRASRSKAFRSPSIL